MKSSSKSKSRFPGWNGSIGIGLNLSGEIGELGDESLG